MAKKYLTPDFDVTAYDINDILTVETGSGDTDGLDPSNLEGGWNGDLEGWN